MGEGLVSLGWSWACPVSRACQVRGRGGRVAVDIYLSLTSLSLKGLRGRRFMISDSASS